MATGLAVPVGVGPNGGARLSTGSENDDKIIRLSLADDNNENAFQQDIGLGVSAIFDVNDVMAKARVMTRLRNVFARFEAQKRYRLREDSIRWTTKEGELYLEFQYWNLESDDTRDYSAPMRTPAKTGQE